MANDTPEYMGYIHHLFAEHRRLNEAVGAIRDDLAKSESDAEVASQWPRLVEDLEQLHDDLTHHFEEEEEGACLEEAISRNPNIGADADRLEGEHEDLLTRLREIIEAIRTSPPSPEVAKDVTSSFHEFADALLAHETTENRIMEQGFNIDLDLPLR